MPERTPQKLFTVAEANDRVPELNLLFAAMAAERELINGILPDVERAAKNSRSGGGSRYGGRYIVALERIAKLLDQVTEMGVIVKDIQTGLCDFLYDQGGELVLLCWRYGEPDVAWWHTLDDGFSGRRNIDELDD